MVKIFATVQMRKRNNILQIFIKCRICGELYTHNCLRSHLLGYATAKSAGRKSRGLHASFTAEYHFDYLKEINKRNQ